jgi:serine/threonine-protein kinase RsbT
MSGVVKASVSGEADLAIVAGRVSTALRGLQAPEEEAARVLTAALELARNIVKYARRGELRFGWARDGRRVSCWVEADDEGPGIADVAQAMEDHFSTGGTLGLGLPGIRRLMDRMEIRSTPGKGTWVRAERTFAA